MEGDATIPGLGSVTGAAASGRTVAGHLQEKAGVHSVLCPKDSGDVTEAVITEKKTQVRYVEMPDPMGSLC